MLINIFGPSTAGKSTIMKLLQKNIANLIIVDYDIAKQQIPDYDWKQHGKSARDATLAMLRSALATGRPTLLLYPPPKDETDYRQIISIARENNYQLENIEMTAPDNVLIERYQQRLATIDPVKTYWKMRTVDEFKTKLQDGYYTPLDTISFDSSQLSPDEILQTLLEHFDR